MSLDKPKIDENFVSYVLDTYDLSDRTRERIERTALFWLRDNGVTDFDEAYTYIDRLAMGPELLHRHWLVSLDDKVGYTDRTLHEIIGTDDEETKKIFETLQRRRKLTGQEVVECLSYVLDRQDTEILSKLMENHNLEFDVSWNYLLENAEQIGERIRQVYERYEQDGVILLPRRPIISVSFDPFEVEFGRERRHQLTRGEIDTIPITFQRLGNNASATARHLGYSVPTITRHLRNEGYGYLIGTPEGNSSLADDEVDRMAKEWLKFKSRGESLNAFARDFGRDRFTVYKHLSRRKVL